MEIVGEAANGVRAIEQTERLRPDLVLMDLDMPECDGFEATREIKTRFPNTRVFILSMHGGDSYRRMAWRWLQMNGDGLGRESGLWGRGSRATHRRGP